MSWLGWESNGLAHSPSTWCTTRQLIEGKVMLHHLIFQGLIFLWILNFAEYASLEVFSSKSEVWQGENCTGKKVQPQDHARQHIEIHWVRIWSFKIASLLFVPELSHWVCSTHKNNFRRWPARCSTISTPRYDGQKLPSKVPTSAYIPYIYIYISHVYIYIYLSHI